MSWLVLAVTLHKAISSVDPLAAADLELWAIQAGPAWLAIAEQAPQERIRGREARLTAEEEFVARKQAEAALRASEERNRLALQAAGMGTWELDLTCKTIVWTPEAAVLFGLTPGAAPQTLEKLKSFVHSDDWSVLIRSIHLVATGERDLATPFRVIWRDGDVHWLESHSQGLRDSRGVITRLAGAFKDVTKRKRAEGAMRFQARLLEAIDQAIIVMNLDGTVRYWNRPAEHLYGWTSEEALGRPLHGLIMEQGDDAPRTGRTLDAIRARLRSGEGWTGEVRVRRKDGSVFQALVTNSPVYDANGGLVGVVGVSCDLADHVQAA
jgi:PAS domain S-box-containing protein